MRSCEGKAPGTVREEAKVLVHTRGCTGRTLKGPSTPELPPFSATPALMLVISPRDQKRRRLWYCGWNARYLAARAKPTAARQGGATKQYDVDHWNADRFNVLGALGIDSLPECDLHALGWLALACRLHCSLPVGPRVNNPRFARKTAGIRAREIRAFVRTPH
jgi:hypothetical protein